MKHLLLASAAVLLLGASPVPNATTQSIVNDPCPAPTGVLAPSGGYLTTNGTTLTAPDGRTFQARGVNVYWQVIAKAITNSNVEPMATLFKGVNLVRINVFAADLSNDTTAALQAYIATLSAKGIVALVEYHEYPNVATGDTLSNVAQFYTTMAAATKGNSAVIFATQNEPAGSISDINSEIRTIYNAIRNTGNGTLILVNPFGGYNPNGMDVSGMTNVAWDLHYYDWLPKSGTNLAAEVAQAQSVARIPVVIGEYGPASGPTTDSGGMAVVAEVQNSGLSSIAWAWETYNGGNPPPGDLVAPPWDGSAGLTNFGQTTAAYTAGSSATGTGSYDAKAFSQQLCQLSQAIYPNAAQNALDAVQQAAQQVVTEASKSPARSSALPSSGSIKDASGYVYTVDAATGNQVMINGQPATPNGEGTNTSAVTTIDGKVYGQDATTHQWFALVQDPNRPYWQPLNGLPTAGQAPSPTSRWATPQITTSPTVPTPPVAISSPQSTEITATPISSNDIEQQATSAAQSLIEPPTTNPEVPNQPTTDVQQQLLAVEAEQTVVLKQIELLLLQQKQSGVPIPTSQTP